MNVVRQTVSKWEKGLSVPDAETVIQIAEVLDTTVNVLLGEEISVSEEPDLTKTLAAKLEVLNEQYSKENEHRRKIRRVVFTAVLIVSAILLIRYLLFFGTIYHIQNTENASASASVTVIGGDVPAYIPLWYCLSVLKPVFITVLAAVVSAFRLYRTRKTNILKIPTAVLKSEQPWASFLLHFSCNYTTMQNSSIGHNTLYAAAKFYSQAVL